MKGVRTAELELSLSAVWNDENEQVKKNLSRAVTSWKVQMKNNNNNTRRVPISMRLIIYWLFRVLGSVVSPSFELSDTESLLIGSQAFSDIGLVPFEPTRVNFNSVQTLLQNFLSPREWMDTEEIS